MTAMARVIEEHKGDIADRFCARLRSTSAAASLPVSEVVDSVDVFLVELAERLRAAPADAELLRSASAMAHGEQRFQLGYELGAVIREYDSLHDIVLEVCAQHGVTPTTGEMRVLAHHFIAGIADAATRYAARRDDEVSMQTARHLAFLTHELRTPLSSATLALTLGRERGELPQSRVIEQAERALRRLQELIDNTLVEIRLHDIVPLDEEDVDVRSFLRETLAELEVEADAKGIALRLEMPADLTVHGDRKALHAAVSNLVRNGVKFSHVRGQVVVRARDGDGRIVVEVEDSCGGLPEGKLHKLFDPFVQAGVDRSGFGLGLAIVKRAATAHKGEVRVHNLPGKGCVFVLDLPLRG